MGILTTKERDGLEEVFLCINTDTQKFLNIKDYYALFLNKKIAISLANLFKPTKFGLFNDKNAQFTSFFSKKKKPLS
jgi:hypothetical protein